MTEDRKFELENAEYKLKETLSYLVCLLSEENITNSTYNYLYENILYVLKDIVQSEFHEPYNEE